MKNGKSDRLIEFYSGQGTDTSGRIIDEIWAYDFDELEWHHDFIQWLFPLDKPSRYISDTPILTPEIAASFSNRPDLKARLRRSLDIMLAFYGLEQTETGEIFLSAKFECRSEQWAYPDDHNHLRLSRIIQSLNLLGLKAEAQNLKEALLQISEQLGPTRIPPGTVRHWRGLLAKE